MSIAVAEEHAALADTVRRWAADHCPRGTWRKLLDADAETLPQFWTDLASQGWLGLHVAEEHGGAGYGFVELAVVVEELGRALTPGPFVPTALAAAIVGEAGSDEARATRLPGLADGSLPAAVAFDLGEMSAERSRHGGHLLWGRVAPVLGAGLARLLVIGADDGQGGEVWALVDADQAQVRVLRSTDATRRAAAVELDGVAVPPADVLTGLSRQTVRAFAATLLAAEAAGMAGWCIDTAADYAKVREQFGRPIGQFQGVKHRVADMLIKTELARAAAWDAARALADPVERVLPATVAAASAVEGSFTCAKDCVQVLGGVGFTWEHDVHGYLKRALAVRAHLGGGPKTWQRQAAELALAGRRRPLDVDLPAQAQALRDEVGSLARKVADLDRAAQRRRLAEHGLVHPYLLPPYGRDASPVEQLVIEQELRAAGVRPPDIGIAAWIVPTLATYGTAGQQEQWLGPTLRGDLVWCQLFSEPDAGSDLASLSTKATRVEGGWLLTGQKVWTSLADQSHLGACLARTNPDAPKHDGITYFIVDMSAEGVEVRPLREMTGEELFNEVFLSDVFVPDDHVIGEVDRGWQAARNTLTNERVSMGSASPWSGGIEGLLGLAAERGLAGKQWTLQSIGELVVEAQVLGLLGLRSTLRTLAGADAGPTGSIRKLLAVEHDQRVSQLALELCGPQAATTEGDLHGRVWLFLWHRAGTIYGGTSEVQRNIIAERALGLPRDL